MKQKNYTSIIWTLTIAINGLIAIAYFLPKNNSLKEYDLSLLPSVNAILNGATFISLVIARVAAKKKDIYLHGAFIFLAFVFTFFFLCSYLLYHFSAPSTKFGGSGLIRSIYFFILITHVFLAALIVPLALRTMSFALNGNIAKHERRLNGPCPSGYT